MNELPLVSCICPTRNRTQFLARSIDCFLKQDYPYKHLIIVEDGDSNSAELIPNRQKIGGLHDKPEEWAGWCQTNKGVSARDSWGQVGDACIHHFHLGAGHRTIGEKRNIACDFVCNDRLIAHWDDDDWHAPSRLSTQVAKLIAEGSRLCGADRLVFHRPSDERAWLFKSVRRPWLAGGTLIYERALWQELGGFKEVNDGEDTAFVDAAYKSGAKVSVIDDPSLYVAMLHDANTTTRDTSRLGGAFPVETVRDWMRGQDART